MTLPLQVWFHVVRPQRTGRWIRHTKIWMLTYRLWYQCVKPYRGASHKDFVFRRILYDIKQLKVLPERCIQKFVWINQRWVGSSGKLLERFQSGHVELPEILQHSIPNKMNLLETAKPPDRTPANMKSPLKHHSLEYWHCCCSSYKAR